MQPAIRHPVIVMIVSLACYGLMDMLLKRASIAMGAVSALFWRNVLAGVALAGFALVRRSRWPSPPALRLHVLRSVVIAAMAVLFFWGLVRVPMAEAMALSFISPLVALALAAAILGERIRQRALAGCAVSLSGVVLIGLVGGTRGDSSWAGLAAVLGSAVLYGWNLVIQRQQALAASPLEAVTFQTVLVALILAPPTAVIGQAPPLDLWPVLAGAAGLGVLSAMLATSAYARAEAQALAPLEFTAFIWAALFGFIGFGEVPGWWTYAGCALIVAGSAVATGDRATKKPAPAP